MKSSEFINEGAMLDMTAAFIPKAVLRWLQSVLHGNAYPDVLKLQKQIMKDQHLSPDLALVKAASTYGIDAKEMQDVLDRAEKN